MKNANLKIVATDTTNEIVPSNTLVIYRGGGYDGCFWEYNAFLKDLNGNYYNLYTSGSRGLTDADFTNKDVLVDAVDSLDFEFIDLSNESEMLNFAKINNADLVLQIGTLVNKVYSYNYNQMPMVFICEECGAKEVIGTNEIDEDGAGFAFGVGTQYNGGMCYSAEKLICYNCYSAGLCSNCNEYVGAENIDENEMECKWCLEQSENE